MEIETITTPVVESAGVETPSQETPQTTQVVPEPQDTTTMQVEPSSKEPQVVEPSRRKASDYYQERKTIRELKESVALMQKKLEEKATFKEEKKPDVPEVPDYDPAHFSPDHKRILAAREKALQQAYDAKIAALEQRFTGIEEKKANAEVERKHQEALEKLFPKTSPESSETLEQRIKKDPERAMRIKEFLIESGLNEFSKTNPELAVEIALQKLGDRPKPNPTVLKKTLMGGNGTGNPGMGEKRTVSEQDLLAEKNKLSAQLETNPSLRHDAKFMERRSQVLSELERLVTKK